MQHHPHVIGFTIPTSSCVSEDSPRSLLPLGINHDSRHPATRSALLNLNSTDQLLCQMRYTSEHILHHTSSTLAPSRGA
ncbi:hypothetical protein CGCA056_v010682 [Colletotrichum aenigma]|uniref:uncharacterized protein n=1 Tax=Colletotrichum aenigma TaxID=1215731 RepID=UPI001872E66C|nr:uncharacterized protein CGCA056_v010682 [Colletotrichum aenigma]KAF5518414.1 hypothetical protein CGCA056_v010682 [Colletotrichum aenigma]